MAFRIEFTLLKPRIWMLSASMLWLGAFALNYYQSQMDATRTLAMMLGVPDAVAVQDFRKMEHSNHMNEVQLTAQVRLRDTRPVPGSAASQLFIIPLYATTEATGSAAPWSPFGFYVSYRDETKSGPTAFGLKEIADIGETSLVTVLGTRMYGQMALSETPYDLSPSDLGLEEGAFVIANGLVERAAVLASPNVTVLRDILFALGCILFSMAIFSWIHGRRQFVIGRTEERPVPQATSPRSQEAFLPLASQDEIRRSDVEERARNRRSRLHIAGALLPSEGGAPKNPH